MPRTGGSSLLTGLHEVCEVKAGVSSTRRGMGRLARSLNELRIPQPMSQGAWSRVLRETVRRNRVRDGLVYLQVTRGAGPRNFLFPPDDVLPTVVCLARSASPVQQEAAAEVGIGVKTMPDVPRWDRCDIKTVTRGRRRSPRRLRAPRGPRRRGSSTGTVM